MSMIREKYMILIFFLNKVVLVSISIYSEK